MSIRYFSTKATTAGRVIPERTICLIRDGLNNLSTSTFHNARKTTCTDISNAHDQIDRNIKCPAEYIHNLVNHETSGGDSLFTFNKKKEEREEKKDNLFYTLYESYDPTCAINSHTFNVFLENIANSPLQCTKLLEQQTLELVSGSGLLETLYKLHMRFLDKGETSSRDFSAKVFNKVLENPGLHDITQFRHYIESSFTSFIIFHKHDKSDMQLIDTFDKLKKMKGSGHILTRTEAESMINSLVELQKIL